MKTKVNSSFGVFWQKWNKSFNNLKPRERQLIFFSTILSVLLIAWSMFLDPMLKKNKLAYVKSINDQAIIDANKLEIANLQIQLAKDPDWAVKQKIEEEKKKLKYQQDLLSEMGSQLIDPSQMSSLLNDILSKNQKLKFISLKNAAPINIIEIFHSPNQKKDELEKNGVANHTASSIPLLDEHTAFSQAEMGDIHKSIYKHEFELVFEGRYMDLLAYLQDLEKLNKHLYWGKARLEVVEYPVSRMTLVIYTLSLDKTWVALS